MALLQIHGVTKATLSCKMYERMEYGGPFRVLDITVETPDGEHTINLFTHDLSLQFTQLQLKEE